MNITLIIVAEASFFEHYQGQPLFKDIYDFLHEMGFEMRGTFGYSYDAKGLPLQCDAIFISRSLANNK